MNNWQSYFDKTFIISLPRRNDRQELIVKQFNEYEIYAEIYDAIEHEKGAYGLMLTMKKLFAESLERGYKKILVFEDDAEIIESKEVFHLTMNDCVEQISKIQWDLFYLGLQHPKDFMAFRSFNLLPVEMGYSTHSVAYSERAMKFFLQHEFDEPIDNWLVRVLQPHGLCFCSYPLLTTQRTTYSDICKERVDWNIYITTSYRNAVSNIMQTRK